MFFRTSFFAFCLLAGGVAGFVLYGPWGCAAGILAGSLISFISDLARALRVTRWLRRLDDGPEPPRVWGMWGEVVERARRALRARENDTARAQARLSEFLAAIQASPNGVVFLDKAGRIEWCNQTAAYHLGFDPERDLLQLVGNLVRDPAFTAYLAAGDYSRDVVIAARASTPTKPMRVSIQLHPYGEGRKLLLSRDVTSIEQAETMRRDFVANVSHEIRTPLTVMTGFIETLQTLPLDEGERTRYLSLMQQQAFRMQALVNDLLTLSRLEGSPLPGGGEWVGLKALTAQCEDEARGLADVLGKSLVLNFAPSPAIEVSAASAELQSAMSNLVTNAIRYSPPDCAIEAGWRLLPDGRLEFSVRDSGAGIAPEHIPRLTERFYRVDRSRSRETGGTGLGLAIVKHVVQRHGGELHIESTVGVGSTFSFQLPATRVRPA